jgi:hypothetical protein
VTKLYAQLGSPFSAPHPLISRTLSHSPFPDGDGPGSPPRASPARINRAPSVQQRGRTNLLTALRRRARPLKICTGMASQVPTSITSPCGRRNRQTVFSPAIRTWRIVRRCQPAGPGPVQIAEPGIAEPVDRAGAVLLPQQRQRHIEAAFNRYGKEIIDREPVNAGEKSLPPSDDDGAGEPTGAFGVFAVKVW